MTARNPHSIVLSRHVTEKSMVLAGLEESTSNACTQRCKTPKAVFRVDPKASKRQIAEAIEEIDQHVVAPLMDSLASSLQRTEGWRIMISPDHPTFLRTKTHTHGNVPITMAGTRIEPDEFTTYGDTNAAKSSLAFDEGWRAMRWFIEL